MCAQQLFGCARMRFLWQFSDGDFLCAVVKPERNLADKFHLLDMGPAMLGRNFFLSCPSDQQLNTKRGRRVGWGGEGGEMIEKAASPNSSHFFPY